MTVNAYDQETRILAAGNHWTPIEKSPMGVPWLGTKSLNANRQLELGAVVTPITHETQGSTANPETWTILQKFIPSALNNTP